MNIKHIPGAIQIARLKKGLSLRKLAELSQVSCSTISRIENRSSGSVTPSVSNKICIALNLDFDDLFYISNSSGGELNDSTNEAPSTSF